MVAIFKNKDKKSKDDQSPCSDAEFKLRKTKTKIKMSRGNSKDSSSSRAKSSTLQQSPCMSNNALQNSETISNYFKKSFSEAVTKGLKIDKPENNEKKKEKVE